jgi:hypothetical protein
MVTRTTTMLIAAAALALAASVLTGCATPDKYSSVSKDFVKDHAGHVIGERETLRNERTGETINNVEVFVVLLDPDGKLVGYEQRVKEGSIVRDVDGRPIGVRYVDLRGRSANPRAGGLLLLY